MRDIIKIKDKKQLQQLTLEEIRLHGPNCDLNYLDVSELTDMSLLFDCSEFNGDTSRWNTSSVVDMSAMFFASQFICLQNRFLMEIYPVEIPQKLNQLNLC